MKYSEKDSLEAISTKDVGQNKSALLIALNPFTLYVINISAFTRKGEGSSATVEELTDEGREYFHIQERSAQCLKLECKWKNPHEAQKSSACSERNRGNLGEVFVLIKCFRNTGCFRKCFKKIVQRHSGLFVWVLSESWCHLPALLFTVNVLWF